LVDGSGEISVGHCESTLELVRDEHAVAYNVQGAAGSTVPICCRLESLIHYCVTYVPRYTQRARGENNACENAAARTVIV
jgi:hypothetical protein